jgi:hypothetical protein
MSCLKIVVLTDGRKSTGDVISRDRFELITKFLHFADNANKANYEGPAKLYKIFPVLSHLNCKFQNLFLPRQNISIDDIVDLSPIIIIIIIISVSFVCTYISIL